MATSSRSPSSSRATRPPRRHAHHAAPSTWEEKDPSIVSLPVQFALRKAMRLENVPLTQYDSLLWIIAQESAELSESAIPARRRVAYFSCCAHNTV